MPVEKSTNERPLILRFPTLTKLENWEFGRMERNISLGGISHCPLCFHNCFELRRQMDGFHWLDEWQQDEHNWGTDFTSDGSSDTKILSCLNGDHVW